MKASVVLDAVNIEFARLQRRALFRNFRRKKGVAIKQSNQDQENNTVVDNIQKQLTILNESSFYFHVIVVAYLLNFEILDIQRLKILCSAVPTDECESIPNSKPYQVTSAILILAAYTYFFNLSKDKYQKPTATKKSQQRSQMFFIASLLNLIASIIRLFLVFSEDTSS